MTTRHPHTYRREETSKGKSIYKCQTCPSYSQPEQVIGQTSLCPFCGVTFVMSLALRGRTKLKLRPHCGCKNIKYRKPTVKTKAVENVLDDLFSIGENE